jgi:hypothetical protein
VSVVVPLFMGYMFDSEGTYETALLAIAVLVILGALSLLLIRRPVFLHPQGEGK